MIRKEEITKILSPLFEEDNDLFLVSISVGPQNSLKVVVDHNQGISIEKCISISRLIEGSLDRDKEDFDLVVTSPGIGQPFKVRQQYFKNVGQHLEVQCNEGTMYKGLLKSCGAEGITLEVTKKVTNPDASGSGKNKKKKIEITEDHTINYEDISNAKVIIKF